MTAVLVAHDGAAWLPDVLGALAASTVHPGTFLCVDTGSTDGSGDLLRAAGCEVLVLPAGTGYGAAVAAALATVPSTRWLWLLHDDAAVEPDTLEALLAHAADSPSAAVLGPKVRDWADPRVLVEVGISTDTSGQRHTGLERREYDQGQHDAVRDVLAVGTAAALVRRDVWDEVGGLDPLLPVYRDDLDLGWRVNAAGHRVVVVPTARIRHVRAATTGRRALGAVSGRPAGIDRRHALLVLLANATRLRLLVTVPELLLACLLRAAGFLLTRRVGAARDELAALGAVLLHPARLLRARRDRAPVRRVSVRPLLASRTGRVSARAEALGDWLSGGAAPGGSPLGQPGEDEELIELAPAGGGALRRLVARPAVALTGGLLLLALVAERAVLSVRGGTLHGGRLLPVPAGARDLWASYADSWHPVSVGSPVDAHPAVAVLAALSTVLLGKPWLALDVLLLGSVPIAGAVAYAAAGRLTGSRPLRVWAGATWALLPVATGAVAQGRVDLAAGQVALPALLALGVRLLSTPTWPRAWALGLTLAGTTAFAPALWPVVAGLLLLGALLARSVRRVAAATIAAAVPAVLLLPWLLDTGLSVLRGGRADTGAADLLLLAPDGHRVVAAALLVVALVALLRPTRHGTVLVCWAVALAGFAAAVALDDPRPGVQVAALGLISAALAGADGLRERLATRSFGWGQVVAALLAAAAVLVPVATGLSWLRVGADGPLQRGIRPVLPAFARAELAARPGLRVLVLRPGSPVRYDLTGPAGERFGDADTPPARSQRRQLDAVVADLLAARGSDAAEALSTRAVAYVAVPSGRGAGSLAAALDLQAGLTRRTSGGVLLWDVAAPISRLTVLPPTSAGPALKRGGLVTLDRNGGPRRRLLTAQAAALALVVVLAAPGARRRRGLEPDDEEVSA
ncbi:MAG: glycosyltransferase family 2 protein [Actinobacteria bacterium]|nr:glycosyltransferase family 2 protein [Actinomycetota bacterium]